MAVLGVLFAMEARAQKIDEDRMQRDIEVAENVLSMLIKQKFEKRSFFPFEVEGKYMAGYGVTFRVPGDFNSNIFVLTENIQGAVAVGGETYSYTYREGGDEERSPKRVRTTTNRDSLATAYNQRIIDASKEFLADYGDMISQLAPEEKIMITNRGENQRWSYVGVKSPRRTLLSVEAIRSDMQQVRQGKLSRDQFMSRVKVVNTTTTEEKDPDLELLSSIFGRLYREDLSKTYYTNEGVYFERLKDFGAIFYMNVYSSTEEDYQRYRMPTLRLDNIDKATRDKKVTELYPQFENELKEHLLEYGRTLKSLKDNETLALNVRITQCKQCGIPSTLELTVKADVLKQFGSGALSREAALGKVGVKKGPAQ
jgi:hypothetical protein